MDIVLELLYWVLDFCGYAYRDHWVVRTLTYLALLALVAYVVYVLYQP